MVRGFSPADKHLVSRYERALGRSLWRWNDLSLRTKGVVLVTVPLVALLGLAFAFAVSNAQVRLTSTQVEEELRAQGGIDAVLQDVVSAETGIRGYLITGRADFLEPYTSAVARIGSDMSALTAFTQNDPAHAPNMAALRSLVTQRFEYFATLTDLLARRTPGLESGRVEPAELRLLQRGRRTTEQIKAILSNIQLEDNRLLALRRADQAQAFRLTAGVRDVGVPLAILFTLFGVGIVMRGMVRRVRRIEDDAEAFAAGGSLGVPLPGADEIGHLSRSILRASALLAERDAAVRQAHARFEDLYNNAPVGYHSAALDGTIEDINDTELAWLGVTRDDVVGKAHVQDFLTAEGHVAYGKMLHVLLRTGRVDDVELGFRRADGSVMFGSVTASAVLDPNGAVVGSRATMADVGERHPLLAELPELATVDELTRLANRRGFMTLAEHALERSRRRSEGATLLFIDLNRLKVVNDTLGHQQGDELIRAASAAIRQATRESDIVGRVGGDVFCVLLLDGEPGSEHAVRARLLAAAHDVTARAGAPWEVSMAIGAVKFDAGSHDSLEALIQEADQRMYQDKLRRRPANLSRSPVMAASVGPSG